MLNFQDSNSSDPPFYFSAEGGSWEDDDLGVSHLGGGGGGEDGIAVLEDPLAGGDGGFGQLRGGGDDLGGAGDLVGGGEGFGDMLSGAGGGGEAGPIDQLAPAQGNPSGGNYLQRAIEVVTGKSPLFVDPGESVVDTSRAGTDWFWVCFFTILGLLCLL